MRNTKNKASEHKKHKILKFDKFDPEKKSGLGIILIFALSDNLDAKVFLLVNSTAKQMPEKIFHCGITIKNKFSWLEIEPQYRYTSWRGDGILGEIEGRFELAKVRRNPLWYDLMHAQSGPRH